MSFLVGRFGFLVVSREHGQLSSRVCLPPSSITPHTPLESPAMRCIHICINWVPLMRETQSRRSWGNTQNESRSTSSRVRLVAPAVYDGPQETAGWNLHCKICRIFRTFFFFVFFFLNTQFNFSTVCVWVAPWRGWRISAERATPIRYNLYPCSWRLAHRR